MAEEENKQRWEDWEPNPYVVAALHFQIHLTREGCCCLGLNVQCPDCPTHQEETRNRSVGLESRLEAAEAERDSYREALEDLYEEQNGAPLLKRRVEWETAMAKARAALFPPPAASDSPSDNEVATQGS